MKKRIFEFQKHNIIGLFFTCQSTSLACNYNDKEMKLRFLAKLKDFTTLWEGSNFPSKFILIQISTNTNTIHTEKKQHTLQNVCCQTENLSAIILTCCLKYTYFLVKTFRSASTQQCVSWIDCPIIAQHTRPRSRSMTS